MLPNLECEVEINEDPDTIPRPLSIKAEKIHDIKTNSIEGAKQCWQSKDERSSSPLSSPITEKEKDTLASDLAEFETDVIGEQLDRKTSDINNLTSEEDSEASNSKKKLSPHNSSNDSIPSRDEILTKFEESASSKINTDEEHEATKVRKVVNTICIAINL